MSLAPYVQIVARGQGRARPLTQEEAQAAMAIMLRGDAAPEAVGALLMVLRLRGEVPSEIAGFTAALRAHVQGQLPAADLDWPCYAAGRTRGAPLFLLAAKLVAQAGFRVSMHGWNSHQQTGVSVRDLLGPLEIGGPSTGGALHYTALETLSPEAFALLRLRDTFGLRSCINTVLRMWNPSDAPATVQGVFHPSYRSLQAEAAEALGQRELSIIKGGGGEFERNPAKAVQVFGLRDGAHAQTSGPALLDESRRLHDPENPVDPVALWQGRLDDEFARAVVIGTAALALWTLRAAPDIAAADRLAATLWQNRHRAKSGAQAGAQS